MARTAVGYSFLRSEVAMMRGVWGNPMDVRSLTINEVTTMASDRKTSKRVAHDASKVLRNPRSSKMDKELGGSALSNRAPQKKRVAKVRRTK